MEFSERFDVVSQTMTVERIVRNTDGVGQLKPWVEVGPSTIPGAGDGVFAARHFRRGEVVGFYVGEIVAKEDRPDDAAYLLELDQLGRTPVMVVDAAYSGNWTRKINDGTVRRNPQWRKSRCNVAFVEHNKIIATTRIKVGTELLMSYGDYYWDEDVVA